MAFHCNRMKHPYLSKMLRDGEGVIAIVRRSPFAMLGRIAAVLFFLCAPFFFLVPLFRVEVWGGWIFIIMLFIGCGIAFRSALLYAFNALVMTDERVIDLDQRGLFHRTVSDAAYERIQDVSFTVKGIRQTLFRYGTLSIETAGSSTRIVVPGIGHPEEVHDHIMRMVTRAGRKSESGDGLDETEILDLAHTLKKNLGDDELRDLIDRHGSKKDHIL